MSKRSNRSSSPVVSRRINRSSSPVVSRRINSSSSPVVGRNGSADTQSQLALQHSILLNKPPSSVVSDPLDVSVSSTYSNISSVIDGNPLSTKVTGTELETTTATTTTTTTTTITTTTTTTAIRTTAVTSTEFPPLRPSQTVDDSTSRMEVSSRRERALTDPGELLLLPKLTPRMGTEESSILPNLSNASTSRKAKTAPNSPCISPRRTGGAVTGPIGSGDTTPGRQLQQQNTVSGDAAAGGGGGSSGAWSSTPPSPRILPIISPRSTNQPYKPLFSSHNSSSDSLSQMEASHTVPSTPRSQEATQQEGASTSTADSQMLNKAPLRSHRWSLESAQTVISENESASRYTLQTSSSEHIQVQREKAVRPSVLSTVSEWDNGSTLSSNFSGKIQFLNRSTNTADRLSMLSIISVDELERDEDSPAFVEDLMSVYPSQKRDNITASRLMHNAVTVTAERSQSLSGSHALGRSHSSDSGSMKTETSNVSNGSDSTLTNVLRPDFVVPEAVAMALATNNDGNSDPMHHPIFSQPPKSSSHAAGNAATRGPLQINTTTTTATTTTTVSSHRKESFVSMSPAKVAAVTPQAKIPARLMVSVLQDIFRELLGSSSIVLAIEGTYVKCLFCRTMNSLGCCNTLLLTALTNTHLLP